MAAGDVAGVVAQNRRRKAEQVPEVDQRLTKAGAGALHVNDWTIIRVPAARLKSTFGLARYPGAQIRHRSRGVRRACLDTMPVQ